jgi:hypothetical protein
MPVLHKHSVESECFNKCMSSKPACEVPECKGLHAEELNDMLALDVSSANAMEYKEEENNEEGCVNTATGEFEMRGRKGGGPLITHG